MSRREFSFPLRSPEEMLQAHRDLIKQISDHVDVPKDVHETFFKDPERSPVYNAAALLSGFPASEEHHDNQPEGLFRHTLIAMREVVRLAKEQRTLGQDPHKRMMTLLYGTLIHDLGKVWWIRAKDPNQPNKEWTMAKGRISRYFPFGTKVQCTLRQGRYNHGINGHEALSLSVLGLILPPYCFTYLGVRESNLLFAAITATVPRDELLTGMIKTADHRATDLMMEKVERRPSVMTFGSGDHAEDMIVAFRELYREQAFSVNKRDSLVFMSKTHTIVSTIGKGKTMASPLLQIIERCKIKAGSASDPMIQHFHDRLQSPEDVIQELLKHSQQRGGQGACIVSDDQPPRIVFQARVQTGRNKNATGRTVSCVVFRNSVLLDTEVQEQGLCAFPIAIIDQQSGTPIMSSDELGFESPTPEVIDLSRPVIVDSVEQVSSLADVTKNILDIARRLHQSQDGSLADRARMMSETMKKSDPGPDVCQASLEIVLDILREHMAQRLRSGGPASIESVQHMTRPVPMTVPNPVSVHRDPPKAVSPPSPQRAVSPNPHVPDHRPPVIPGDVPSGYDMEKHHEDPGRDHPSEPAGPSDDGPGPFSSQSGYTSNLPTHPPTDQESDEGGHDAVDHSAHGMSDQAPPPKPAHVPVFLGMLSAARQAVPSASVKNPRGYLDASKHAIYFKWPESFVDPRIEDMGAFQQAIERIVEMIPVKKHLGVSLEREGRWIDGRTCPIIVINLDVDLKFNHTDREPIEIGIWTAS